MRARPVVTIAIAIATATTIATTIATIVVLTGLLSCIQTQALRGEVLPGLPGSNNQPSADGGT
jgi:hypothetical protein